MPDGKRRRSRSTVVETLPEPTRRVPEVPPAPPLVSSELLAPTESWDLKQVRSEAIQNFKDDFFYFNGLYVDPSTVSSVKIEPGFDGRGIDLTIDTKAARNMRWHIGKVDEAKPVIREIIYKVYGDE